MESYGFGAANAPGGWAADPDSEPEKNLERQLVGKTAHLCKEGAYQR